MGFADLVQQYERSFAVDVAVVDVEPVAAVGDRDDGVVRLVLRVLDAEVADDRLPIEETVVNAECAAGDALLDVRLRDIDAARSLSKAVRRVRVSIRTPVRRDPDREFQ